MNTAHALNLVLPNGRTIREFLCDLLILVWEQGEDFSGKRPFGDSAWQYEIYEVLVREGFISGSFDAYGSLQEVDESWGDAMIVACINDLMKG